MPSENLGSKTSEMKDLENNEQGFKKTYQTVGKPPVTDHDINEDGLTDPPQNVPSDATGTQGRGQQYPPVETEVDEYELENGEEGPGNGRPKRLDVEKELIGSSETNTASEPETME